MESPNPTRAFTSGLCSALDESYCYVALPVQLGTNASKTFPELLRCINLKMRFRGLLKKCKVMNTLNYLINLLIVIGVNLLQDRIGEIIIVKVSQWVFLLLIQMLNFNL